MDDKVKALLEISRLQARAGGLMMQSESVKAGGDFVAARAVYAEYVAALEDLLQASLRHNEQFPDTPFDAEPTANMLANALMVAADVVQSLGDRAEAEELRQRALQTSRDHLGRAGTAETERSRAASLTLEGRFNEAIAALYAARDLVMEQGDVLELARVTIDLADVLQWLGDLQRAKEEIVHAENLIAPMVTQGAPTRAGVFMDLLSDAAAIMSGQGNPGTAASTAQLYRAYIEVTYYHGLISKALGEWDEAERCFTEVLPHYQRLGTGEALEFQQAMVDLGRGRHRAALDRLRRIEHVFEGGVFRPKKGVLQRAQAECLHALGETAEAARLVDESVADLTTRHFDPDALWRSQRLTAQLRAATGDRPGALAALGDAVDTISALRRRPLGYRLDSTFLADKLGVFSEAVAETLAAGDLRRCCRFMDVVKSRTLSAVLSIPAAPDPATGALPAELDDVTRRLDVMEYQAYREGWTPERRQAHRDLLGHRSDLLERIRISDPRWRSLTEAAALDVDRLLAALDERSQAALALYRDGDTIHAVLAAGGELRGGRVEVAANVLDSLRDYAQNLQRRTVDVFKHDLSAEYSVAAVDLLPAALLERALEFESLVVVPHGILHLVPWSGLVHEGSRLFAALPVGVLPNLASLLGHGEAAPPAQVMLVGVSSYGDAGTLDDLPSTAEELRLGAQAHPAERVTATLLDDDATEARFWAEARRLEGAGALLHVSCHGVIVPGEPMSSGLLLADAKVDAAEVARSGLRLDEVVLSACWTGWRPTEVGDVVLDSDEILGIPGGFLEAGARSVLVSIPKGEGKTARDLTAHYHQRRAAGEPPLAAYRSAQLHMLGQESVPPALWIGFTMYGCR